MAQIGRFLLTQNVVKAFVTDDLQQVTPSNNKIYILGGDNINTSASSNTVYGNLDTSISINNSIIGNISTIGSLITSVPDLYIEPTKSDGGLKFGSSYTGNRALYQDATGILQNSSEMQDGYLLISNGTTLDAKSLIAGDGITITNSSGAVEIAASTDQNVGQGGLLGWDYHEYNTGDSQANLRITLTRNRGIILNSTVATLSASNHCPKTNFVLTMPTSGSLSFGDTFWIVNKGIGSVLIKGLSGQYFVNATFSESTTNAGTYVTTNSVNDFTTRFIVPEYDNTSGTKPTKYLYLTSIVLVYIGELRYINPSTFAQTNYAHTFIIVKSVGNYRSILSSDTCYIKS